MLIFVTQFFLYKSTSTCNLEKDKCRFNKHNCSQHLYSGAIINDCSIMIRNLNLHVVMFIFLLRSLEKI